MIKIVVLVDENDLDFLMKMGICFDEFETLDQNQHFNYYNFLLAVNQITEKNKGDEEL